MKAKINKPVSCAILGISILFCSCSERLCTTYSRVSKEHYNNILNSNKVECYVQQPYTDRYKAAMQRKYLKYKN
ncbi:MAG: hypothetical protein ACM3NR_01800 [Methanosarcina sp.]